MSENVSDNEVQVGKNKLSPNTIIQVNLKTLIIILSFISSGLVYLWREVKSSSDSNMEKVVKLQEEIKAIKDQDLKTISIQLNQVDGKVQGIFMNLQRDIYNPNLTPTNTTTAPQHAVRPSNPK